MHYVRSIRRIHVLNYLRARQKGAEGATSTHALCSSVESLFVARTECSCGIVQLYHYRFSTHTRTLSIRAPHRPVSSKHSSVRNRHTQQPVEQQIIWYYGQHIGTHIARVHRT